MKKLFYLPLFLFSSLLFAASASDFNIDHKQLQIEMSELSKLELLVIEKQVDLNEVRAQYPDYLVNIGLLDPDDDPFPSSSDPLDMPLGVPAFIWGLCCRLPGVLIVGVHVNDKKTKSEALYGCLIGVVTWSAVALIVAID